MIELGCEHFDASKFSKFGTHRSTLSVLRSTFPLEYLYYRSTFSTVGVLVLFLRVFAWSKYCSLTEINISENHVYQWVVSTEINISEIMFVML